MKYPIKWDVFGYPGAKNALITLVINHLPFNEVKLHVQVTEDFFKRGWATIIVTFRDDNAIDRMLYHRPLEMKTSFENFLNTTAKDHVLTILKNMIHTIDTVVKNFDGMPSPEKNMCVIEFSSGEKIEAETLDQAKNYLIRQGFEEVEDGTCWLKESDTPEYAYLFINDVEHEKENT